MVTTTVTTTVTTVTMDCKRHVVNWGEQTFDNFTRYFL